LPRRPRSPAGHLCIRADPTDQQDRVVRPLRRMPSRAPRGRPDLQGTERDVAAKAAPSRGTSSGGVDLRRKEGEGRMVAGATYPGLIDRSIRQAVRSRSRSRLVLMRVPRESLQHFLSIPTPSVGVCAVPPVRMCTVRTNETRLGTVRLDRALFLVVSVSTGAHQGANRRPGPGQWRNLVVLVAQVNIGTGAHIGTGRPTSGPEGRGDGCPARGWRDGRNRSPPEPASC
jgi:hypothetical protein